MRTAGIIGVCLLIGAATTWVVAWGCATWSGTVESDFDYDRPVAGGHYGLGSRVPLDWDHGTWLWHRGFGIQSDWVSEMPWLGSRPGIMLGKQNRTLHRVAVGWPAPALEWVCDGDLRLERDPSGREPVWLRGLDPLRGGGVGWAGDRRLPVKPLWIGFALDTVSYGAAAWCGLWGWRVARSALWVRRGRCAGCGYAAAGLSGCPECGRCGPRAS